MAQDESVGTFLATKSYIEEMEEMKKQVTVLAIVSLLALVQASQAANLQTGWYVDIDQVWVWAYQWPDVPPHPVAWGAFTSPAGQHGPFAVSYPDPNNNNHVRVTVTSDSYGVGSEQSLILPVAIGQTSGSAYIGASINTNYDANQMVLEFWRSRPNYADQMLSTYPVSGNTWYNGQIDWGDGVEGSYYFKLAVASVPEPSALVGLSAALACLGFTKVRRRK